MCLSAARGAACMDVVVAELHSNAADFPDDRFPYARSITNGSRTFELCTDRWWRESVFKLSAQLSIRIRY